MIRTCLFDLDGTLLNTIKTIAYYGNYALQKHGYSTFFPERYKTFVGDGARTLVRRMLIANGVEDDEIFERVYATYIAAYDATPLYLTEPYDGILTLLTELRSKGVLVGVISNKQDAATAPTVLYFFRGYVDFIRGALEGVPLKPSPESVFDAMAYLRAEKETTLFIGDTSVDVKTGKNAGVRTVGCLWGFRDERELRESGADFIVGHPRDIIRLIEEENDGTK